MTIIVHRWRTKGIAGNRRKASGVSGQWDESKSPRENAAASRTSSPQAPKPRPTPRRKGERASQRAKPPAITRAAADADHREAGETKRRARQEAISTKSARLAPLQSSASKMKTDPVDVLSDFLDFLPNTIQKEVVFFVLSYAFDYENQADDELGQTVIEILRERRGLRRLGAVLRCVGVIDFVLQRHVASLRGQATELRRILQKPTQNPRLSGMFDILLTVREMNRQQAEAALRRWKALRANELSPRRLSRLEKDLLRPRAPIKGHGLRLL